MNDYNFGNFICMLRENKGLTQQNIADMLGVTPAAVSKWENGSSKPRVEVLFQLANILDVKAEELMAGKFLPEETLNADAVKQINERYEYLSKTESHASTSVKLKRFIAAIIDYLIATTVSFFVFGILYENAMHAGMDSLASEAIYILSSFLSFLLVYGFRDFIFLSTSLGKRIMGLVILDKKTGQKATMSQKLLRNITLIIYLFLSCILFIDAVLIFVKGQSIGDSFANTLVAEKDPCEKRKRKKNDDITEPNDPFPSEIDLEKINTYTPPPRFNKKRFFKLIPILVVTIVIAISLSIFYFMKLDIYEAICTDISTYETDCAIYENASDFMPDLESLTDHTDLFYSHKTSASRFMGFVSEGLALFVQYDELLYKAKKEEVLNSYTFLDAPILQYNDEFYILPVTEFHYKNYHMKVVPDIEHPDSDACESFALIGFDDENKSIVYCYHYDIDLDYIAKQDEDPEAEMCIFMDSKFEWKPTN